MENMTREDLIAWLEHNDHNGCYNDKDSIIEFGRIATYEELLECYNNQING